MWNKHIHLQYLIFASLSVCRRESLRLSSDVIWHSVGTMNALQRFCFGFYAFFHSSCHSWANRSNLSNKPEMWQAFDVEQGEWKKLFCVREEFVFFLPVMYPNTRVRLVLVSAGPDCTPGRSNNCFHVLASLSTSCVRPSFLRAALNQTRWAWPGCGRELNPVCSPLECFFSFPQQGGPF